MCAFVCVVILNRCVLWVEPTAAEGSLSEQQRASRRRDGRAGLTKTAEWESGRASERQRGGGGIQSPSLVLRVWGGGLTGWSETHTH